MTCSLGKFKKKSLPLALSIAHQIRLTARVEDYLYSLLRLFKIPYSFVYGRVLMRNMYHQALHHCTWVKTKCISLFLVLFAKILPAFIYPFYYPSCHLSFSTSKSYFYFFSHANNLIMFFFFFSISLYRSITMTHLESFAISNLFEISLLR